MVRKSQQQSGFTIIEMIVSLGLFSVVVTISIGALLVLISTSDRLQSEQNVMTNLSFALDSMTRELRTGTYYYCASDNDFVGVGQIFNDSYDLDSLGIQDRDCVNGRNAQRYHGVSFVEAGDSVTAGANRILYYYHRDDQMIYRRIGDQSSEPIISTDVAITNADFVVTDSDPLFPAGTDTDQPTVTIFLDAEQRDNPSEAYHIQTTVTQRVLDI